jgi:hypothetical protein
MYPERPALLDQRQFRCRLHHQQQRRLSYISIHAERCKLSYPRTERPGQSIRPPGIAEHQHRSFYSSPGSPGSFGSPGLLGSPGRLGSLNQIAV